MNKLFPTYEVGSMPKLNARVKAFRADPENPVTKKDLDQISNYSSRISLFSENLISLLENQIHTGEKLDSISKKEIIDFNALLNLRLQENSGLDYVYDGEARRSEMYRHVAKDIQGFEDYSEMLRSRGPDSWKASICKSEPKLKSLENLAVVDEFNFVKKGSNKAYLNNENCIKVPFDDPYMIANMTGNEYYVDKLRDKYDSEPRKLKYEAKRELTLALAKNIIRPQVEAVVNGGAKWVQLDIPSATIDIEHIPIMVDGVNEVVEGIDDTKFSLHICYPRRVSLTDKKGFDLLFPYILDLNPSVDHLSLEMANGGQYEEDLAPFAKYQDERRFEIGAGVVDITLERQQQGLIETPEEVRNRIDRIVNVLKDPELVYVAPDCGLRQLSLERTVELFDVVVEGAELARRG